MIIRELIGIIRRRRRTASGSRLPVSGTSVASLTEKLEDALREIEHLEKQLRIARLEIEVHKREAEQLAFVVARDRERIAAETAIYVNASLEGKLPTDTPVGNVQSLNQASSWY